MLRCPECGGPFEWREVLARARHLSVELFESRWTDAPLRALGRTWGLAAFRPKRLWDSYALAGRPRVAPLLLFVALQWLVFAQGWQVVAMAADPLMNALGSRVTPPIRYFYNFRPGRGFFSEMAAWYAATLAVLQVFVQTNRRFGIGWRQTLRVWVHATAFASLLSAAWCLLEAAVDASLLVAPSTNRIVQRLYLPLQLGVFLLGIAVTWAHLWIGYRRHLRVPHGWGIAALAMLLGYLLTELALIYV